MQHGGATTPNTGSASQTTADVTSCLIRSALSSSSPADQARNKPTQSSAASLPRPVGGPPVSIPSDSEPTLRDPTVPGGTGRLSRGQETWPATPGAASFLLPHCDLEATSAATPGKHGQDGRLVAQPKPVACRQPPSPSHLRKPWIRQTARSLVIRRRKIPTGSLAECRVTLTPQPRICP
jgi:hypothetical protein